MIYVGVNAGTTSSGMKLNDGGCCIIKNGEILAIAEERVTQKKYAGGFDMSLEYCLNATNTRYEDVTKLAISSCCEKKKSSCNIEHFTDSQIVICPSHHLSHALSCFMTSPFREAIIIVIDNEGNILDDDDNENLPFHKRKLEHMSYYIGNEDGVHLLERDFVNPNKIGLGDAYRYFTHYLGFPSYSYAGKTMGLAAYGNEERFKNVRLFNLDNGHITCDISNDYFDCEKSLETYLKKKLGKDFVAYRNPIDDITQDHADLARLIQRETERILSEKVDYLIKKTGIKNICISGGLGLNTVANSYIKDNCDIDGIYIVPAAGDSGQCLGNAIYAYCQDNGYKKHFDINHAYLGKEYSDKDIEDAIQCLKKNSDEYDIDVYCNKLDLANRIADELSKGRYIGNFYGRSEFGPRALGNRSILANPIMDNTKDDLNEKIKYREYFRPFAPIVKCDKAANFFEIEGESPYMLLVAKVRSKREIPAVTHRDGTARVQTMTPDQNEHIYNILDFFEKMTGIPVILNTSFNINGKPIVETPQDAVNCFISTNLDDLAIGNYLIKKKNNRKMFKPDVFNQFTISLGKNL